MHDSYDQKTNLTLISWPRPVMQKSLHHHNCKTGQKRRDKCNLARTPPQRKSNLELDVGLSGRNRTGGPNGIRTRGLLGASEALCQTELWAQSNHPGARRALTFSRDRLLLIEVVSRSTSILRR